ncbi:hypothetical protein BH20BAC1_BH20BAC1_12910 [soil metagenome]
MQKLLFVFLSISLLALSSCHKKNYPGKSTKGEESNTSVTSPAKSDSTAVAKVVVERKPKVAVAKVITVNDNAARKSVDGRLYYDVAGRRYWKNYKDGKYYLFDKAMYNNADFKPR